MRIYCTEMGTTLIVTEEKFMKRDERSSGRSIEVVTMATIETTEMSMRTRPGCWDIMLR